jgi:hypothetical protein
MSIAYQHAAQQPELHPAIIVLRRAQEPQRELNTGEGQNGRDRRPEGSRRITKTGYDVAISELPRNLQGAIGRVSHCSKGQALTTNGGPVTW